MAQKNSKSSKKKNNGGMFTAACVILGLLVIAIIFLVKKDQIFSNMKETAFFDRVFGSTPAVIENHEVKPSKSNETIPLKNEEVTIKIEEEETTPIESVTEKTEAPAAEESKPQENTVAEKPEEKKESSKETKKESPAPKTSEVELCFVLIDGDGSVVRKLVTRTVTKNDSPLTNSINLLLQGPDTTKSAEKNCMTVIPRGTKLLSAKVQNGVAYLSFNEALEINEYGVEGKIHSLEQIVYTATAFSTVNSVQILIDGQKKEYLGEEGQWIGSPLSKNSF
ncbi:MAG: GerMN domain-containing protein [Treponema sp.]|nr:GerMN domain-containing protein [Treponema sp.]